MLQETRIATRAQEKHAAPPLQDKGYIPFFSSHLVETAYSPRSAASTWLSTRCSASWKSSQARPWPWESARTRGASLSSTSTGRRPAAPPWAGRAAFWGDIQMYAAARRLGGRPAVMVAGNTNIYMDTTTNPTTEQFCSGWEVCGFQGAAAGAPVGNIPTLHPSRRRVDTFLVNEPLLLWPLRESVWAPGLAQPQVVGSDHLPVRLFLTHLLGAAGEAEIHAASSHTVGRLLLYDPNAAPVQRCLWTAVTAAQDDPSLAPWLGPAKQHAYEKMTAAAADKMFEHLHAAHESLARVVGRQHPSLAGMDPSGKDSRKVGNNSGITPGLRARWRCTRRTRPSTASTQRQHSGWRKCCGTCRHRSALPRWTSCKRSWSSKQRF